MHHMPPFVQRRRSPFRATVGSASGQYFDCAALAILRALIAVQDMSSEFWSGRNGPRRILGHVPGIPDDGNATAHSADEE